MFFTNITFIGIDPTAGEKPLVYAAINHEKRLLALSSGSLDDVLAFAAGQRQALVAVCGPRQPNLGLMKDRAVRNSLVPAPTHGRWENFRLADYLLRQHNLSGLPIYEREELCPNWMRQSFALFRRLHEIGYQLYPQEGAERLCLEVYPHAAFSVMLGLIPFQKHTLEGRLQRQLILYERKLEIADPMDFFEEITRHRLLKGIQPLDELYQPGELDALAAAYTAWLAATSPDRVALVGDPQEGQVVLPAAALIPSYS